MHPTELKGLELVAFMTKLYLYIVGIVVNPLAFLELFYFDCVDDVILKKLKKI